ncbi:hypothetical protein [Bradyrhizobium sp. WYCCWR 12699]|uniref:hypothetical protein n=1 Tax=Bradyrhizobium sp. WYCCWR 12699 TaxID=3064203 RepID=UPI0028A43BE6|nr:hypothetical protein [Bradyrhizobium sp. WYCCWR 12699]MDT4743665.1 hypothetical protein [Bradyrhizobium sp. WYCCWR 12699]
MALWSAAALASFRATAPARDITARIIADERFRPGALADMQTKMSATSTLLIIQPEFALARALVAVSLAEQTALRMTSGEADREIGIAEAAVKSSLSLNPTDSFLWLMLYSLKTTRSGFGPDNVKYLDQSYLAAPLDGWIVLRRSRLALAIFPLLSAVVQSEVVSEFAALVDSGFFDEAAFILTNVGWNQREILLQSLQPLDPLPREAFAKRLEQNGAKVRVPGVVNPERPWR